MKYKYIDIRLKNMNLWISLLNVKLLFVMYTFNKKVVDSNFYTYIKENYSIVNSKNRISIIISYYYKNRFV